MTSLPDKVYLSAPIAKTVETSDGGREVWGYATLERVDKSGEIADFDGTVKAFETWSSEVEKRTNGKSLGNVRLMHQPVVAGKTIHWEPTETTVETDNGEETVKAIWVGAYVPPTKPDVIKDIDEGILSGFSIGGSYAKRWWDDTAKAFRFVPELSEYSLVDNPCVPGADIVNVFSKADGPWGKPERNLAAEGGENVEKRYAGSYEELSERLYDACKDKFTTPYQYFDGYIVATWPDRFVLRDWCNDCFLEIPYSIGEDGAVTLGEPKEVERVESFVPVDAMKAYESEVTKRAENAAQRGSDAVTAEEIQKAAEQAGLTLEQVKAFFKAMDSTQPSDPPAVTTVDGDGDKDGNKAFPNPPDDPVNIPKAESEIKAADKEAGVESKPGAPVEEQNPGNPLKADEGGDLQKAGKAISKTRGLHMAHAMNHLKAAMDGSEYGPEQHLSVESEYGQGNTGEEPPEATAKTWTGFLQKNVGGLVTDELKKVTGTVEALVKGLATSESLTKAMDTLNKTVERIDAIEKLVKEIHAAPQPSGVVLNGGSADMLKSFSSGPVNTADMETQALENLIKSTTDPLVKDRISQELAIRLNKAQFKGGF